MTEAEELLNKWREVPCSWIGRLKYILRCQTFPKLIKRFNVIPIKILGRLFVEIKKLIVKYIWGDKGRRTAKTVLKRLKS